MACDCVDVGAWGTGCSPFPLPAIGSPVHQSAMHTLPARCVRCAVHTTTRCVSTYKMRCCAASSFVRQIARLLCSALQGHPPPHQSTLPPSLESTTQRRQRAEFLRCREWTRCVAESIDFAAAGSSSSADAKLRMWTMTTTASAPRTPSPFLPLCPHSSTAHPYTRLYLVTHSSCFHLYLRGQDEYIHLTI
ncbi:hypothetical protein C8Q72DRAFT_418277 [Fomitopsis betulina]|nr:hypothetical protein C8Q72DRAFT_418277 [Fomitopsis betulina]